VLNAVYVLGQDPRLVFPWQLAPQQGQAQTYGPIYASLVGDLRNCISSHNWNYPHLLSAGSPKGEMPNARGERQEAGSSEPAGCGRRRASLYQPMVLGIANKAAAAVLLPVNRAG
jgi:hypothetical protein